MIFKDRTVRTNIVLFLLIFIILISVTVGNNLRNKQNTKKEEPNLSIKTESNIFKLDSITLYSSANAINNSDDQSKWNLNIYQYTDISIKLDNMVSMEELTNKNTVKKLYIDNIKFPSEPSLGKPSLYYKDPNKFGIATVNDEYLIKNSLNYKIITKNEDIDYSSPIYYTDCSNPITLSYINKDVVPDFTVENTDSTIIFDGSLLRDSSVLLSTISSTVSFTIHIVNYLDEEFTCDVVFEIPLEDNLKDIYSGSYTKELTKFHSNKFYKIGE